MDPRERWSDLQEVIRSAVERGQSRMWTSIPAKVVRDSDGFTCRLQPLIQHKEQDPQGKEQDVNIAELPDVPVQFSAGGGFTITHPIKEGDEGIVVFSSRCIDNWWDKGGVQSQHRQRWHSLSDGMYIPGIRSKPRALGGNPDDPASRDSGAKPSTNSVQIRSDDGKFYIELGENGAVNIIAKTVTIKASDKVRIETPVVEIKGDLKVSGEITSFAAGVRSAEEDAADPNPRAGSSTTVSGHRHSNVRGGPDESGPPVPNT